MAGIKSDQLYERAKEFALGCAKIGSVVPKTTANITYFRQLVRSSASIAANYLEAQEALGKQDFVFRLKICQKEAKESRYWLELLSELNHAGEKLIELQREADELVRIFSKSVRTTESH